MGAVERVSLEPAWVLHRYPYRDSSLLVEVFSHEYGRVGLVARGARSPKSRWYSELQILRPLLLSWNMRGDLGTLTGAEGRAIPLPANGRKVLCASYLNELLLRLLTRHDPHPALFDAYERAIDGLVETEEQALRYFEKHLLQELGYGLLLDCEFESGEPLVDDTLYEYRLEQGPVRCRQQGSEGIYLRGESLLAFSAERLDGRRACREILHLTRAALALYLGARPLKTRTVLNQLASMTPMRRLPSGGAGTKSGLEVIGYMLLGVNIDHVATLRQARGTHYPDPVQAAIESEQAGADSITLHLREDRRHIQERDVRQLKDILQTRMNLEMAVTDEMLAFAGQVCPEDCCLVPERREELTTEGGLDVAGQLARIRDACQQLSGAGIRVSLFIDADRKQVEAAVAAGAPCIEIHTGHFADAPTAGEQATELARIIESVRLGVDAGLKVHAGHGLNYDNVGKIAAIPDILELNIGHAIIARALFTGLGAAVSEMKHLMMQAHQGAR